MQEGNNNQTKKKRSFFFRKNPSITLFALGGLGEIGKNMYCIRYGNEIIIVDCGIKFAGNDLPGIDGMIPDVEYLQNMKGSIKGIFITHAHEDHIGGLPYILKKIKAPVYGAALTVGLIKAKLEEHGMVRDVDLHIVDQNMSISFDKINVSFFDTNHSIPDSMGIIIDTPLGCIVHTGDFKIDLTPVDKPSNFAKMAEVGKKGVLALLSDSTNSEKSGYTPSEKKVGQAIEETFKDASGRIIFATFASNVHRLQQVIDACWKLGRKLVVMGRSMEKVFTVGKELGYLQFPDDEMFIDVKQIHRYPSNQVVVVCTGSQGEPQAALTRIANGSHRQVVLEPEDTVIFSSSPIPGNTRNVYQVIDLLFKKGAKVIYHSIVDIHTSGHGCQEDLKFMLRMMTPKYFVPIHGEYRMLLQHAQIAESTGVSRENIFLLDNGMPLHIQKSHAKIGKRIMQRPVYVSRNELTQNKEVIDERLLMGENGVVMVIVTLDKISHLPISGPEIMSRGFVYIRESNQLVRESSRVVYKVLHRHAKKKQFSITGLEKQIVTALENYYEKALSRVPVILPIIQEAAVTEASTHSK